MGSRKPDSIKTTPDGRAMLNVGCGAVTHMAWNNLDFGPYARLRRRPMLTAVLKCLGILTERRRKRLEAVDPDIIAWDIRRGLPFPDDCLDVVYHSNVIEHLGRQAATKLVCECGRVLKAGGTLRVVTPDTELLARQYLEVVSEIDARTVGAEGRHEDAVRRLFEQMVREEGEGSKPLGRAARIVENLLRGGAATRGEKHLWAYDRVSLSQLVAGAGLREVRVVAPADSRIPDWNSFDLDIDEQGQIRSSHCLYMEAVKP